MPGPVRQLTVEEARDHIKRCCFRSPAPNLVGLETEWLVVAQHDATAPVPFERLRAAIAAAGRLPGGSTVTYEPGGQLELSGRPAGWKSTRLATWFAIDPSRTAPVAPGASPAAWADYALGARVMFIRVADHHFCPINEPLSFQTWLLEGHELGHPTLDDLDYHL